MKKQLTDFAEHLLIIRKKFPLVKEIEETEWNTMLQNQDRILLKKQHYNDYCFVEICKGTSALSFTIFKSDWIQFKKIESDMGEGFSFAPKDEKETAVIINALV